MSKLEKQDPEYLLAMEEYKRQLAKREELSIENLLLRLNSVCHATHALVRLIDRTKGEYRQVLTRYMMDEEKELEALEGCTGPAAQVRATVSLTKHRLCGPRLSTRRLLDPTSHGRINDNFVSKGRQCYVLQEPCRNSDCLQENALNAGTV